MSPAVAAIVLFGIAIIAGTLAIVVPTSFKPAGRQAQKSAATSQASVVPATAGAAKQEKEQEPAAARERLEGEADGADLPAEPGRAVLEGFAIFSAGDPAPGARIKAVRYKDLDDYLPFDSCETFETVAAEDGWFAFKNIPPGGYSVLGVMEGFAGHLKVTAAGRADHPQGMPIKHRLILKQSGTIQGCVVGSGVKPLSGAHVMASDIPASSILTDEEGRFILSDLVAGVYSIIASASGMGFTIKHKVPTPTSELEIVMNEGGSFSGTVTLNGKPVSNVQVRAVLSQSMPMSTILGRTDGKGRYHIGPVGDSKYYVDVLSDRYASARRYLSVKAGEKLEGIDFALERCAAVAGRVVRKSDEAPLEGIWVCAQAKDRHRFHQSFSATHCRTDGEGRFVLPALSPQDYQIAALCGEGYRTSFWNDGKSLSLEPGEQRKDLVLTLEPGAALDIKVTKESGGVMEGAKISLNHANRREMYTTSYRNLHLLLPKASEKGGGLYRMEGIPPGVYNLWSYVPGWKSGSETVAVEEGIENETVEMEMKPGFQVAGRVADPDNAGIPGACVSLSRGSCAITDGEGKFFLEGLTSSYQRVSVYAEGYVNYYKRHSSLSEDEEVLITLVQSGSHYLAGRVVNDLSQPLPKVKITVTQYNGTNRLSREVISGDDGSFR
ncbi:MAG: carboxypeptidase regulatory-like domain-containing protein, partial [Planctomycetota bacterium]